MLVIITMRSVIAHKLRGALLKSKTDPMLDTKFHLYQII